MALQASPRRELESSSAVLTLVAPRSREIGRIRIVDTHGRASIQTLDPAEAAARGEEIVQLSEGRSYEYELLDVDARLELERSAVVQPSNLRRGTGRLEPGVSTGLLALRVIDPKTGQDVASAGVEVRTSKIDYHSHYRRMLADVSETSCALLLDIRAPSQARLTGGGRDAASLHEQFVILRGLLERDEARDAVARVLDQPARKWVTESIETDPRKAFHPSRSITNQIASRAQRARLPEGHALSARLGALGFERPSVPAHFTVERQAETLDTPENRFVKFVLEEWESFLVNIAVRLGTSESPASLRVQREVEAIRKLVSGWLSYRLFTEVGALTALPLASPVLQRKAGYREVLGTWLTFRAGTALVWSGGSDVFGGGSKDVALLYEYWVFFELLEIVERVFELDSPIAFGLLEGTADGLDLKLRSGRTLDFTGRYVRGSRPLSARFSYNRTFVHSSRVGQPKVNYPAAGSWTKPMRPDYTLSFWPAEFSEREAERQELMTHVHFDAKYRVDDLTTLFGQDTGSEEELDEEKRAFRTNQVAKRSDLLKMHAYRDAIRRTEGAYVIYPGSSPTESQEWWAFHELLPGLGAFSLMPGASVESERTLEEFIGDIAEFVCADTTRLEQQTYHTFRIQEESGAYRASPTLPARDTSDKPLRERPPTEM